MNILLLQSVYILVRCASCDLQRHSLAPNLATPVCPLQYGFIKLALVIMMVFLVHLVEAYGLNPAIYSAHLKLHPLLVLSVLVVAEHSLGIWGLMLAVPLTVFTLDYVIAFPKSGALEVGRRELEMLKGSSDEGDMGVPSLMVS